MSATYIIGEIGSNFNQSIEQAKELIGVAASAGVDAAKFQLFRADVLYPDGPSEVHQAVKKCELPPEWLSELKGHCASLGIDFLVSPFDVEAVDHLEKIDVGAYKIASSEVSNRKLLLRIARTRKPIFLSVGMSSMADVSEAIEILDSNQSGDVTLLHCTSVYPTPFKDVALRVIQTLKAAFGKSVGFSDHSLGIHMPVAAVTLGAEVIEKHFTLSRELEGPDHSYALEPDELKEMVRAIRQTEIALTGDRKLLLDDEKRWGRLRGLYSKNILPAGSTIQIDDLISRRPLATAIPARYKRAIVGERILRRIEKDEPITWDAIG